MDVSTCTSSGTAGTSSSTTVGACGSFSIAATEVCHFGRAIFAQY